MKPIKLPHTDLEISPAVFGTSRLGGTVQSYDKKGALKILGMALDAGIHTFDTADIYAQGNSEKLLAEAFKNRRGEVVLATKGGYVFSGKAKLLSRLKPLARRIIGKRPGIAKVAGKVRGGQMKQDFSAEYLSRALEGSLTRLRTDCVDLYQLHSPDRDTLERGEAFESLARLKQQGKIRAYGASLLSWDHLELCFGKGVAFVQVEADLLAGGGRRDLLKEAEAAGVAVIARQPFASGLFTRDLREWTAEDFGGDAVRLATARERMTRIREAGDPYRVILQYLVRASAFPAFLFATTRPAHLEANLEAIKGEDLDTDLLRALFETTLA